MFRQIRHIKQSAHHLACGSVIYDWRLRGHTPERLIVKPADPWKGNAEAGEALCDGAFLKDGEQLDLRGGWEPIGAEEAWLDHIHGFSWLRDLRAAGGDEARGCARGMAGHWMRHYGRWHKRTWRPDIAGERLAAWISHYEFFAGGADEEYQELFFDSAIRQARHLKRALPGELHGLPLLKGIKGLLYAGLAFEGYELWVEYALSLLTRETGRQILPDGSHISRSPAQLLESLKILLEVKTTLAAAGHPLPEMLQFAIDRAGPALRFFRYGDKNFGLWNGAQEGDAALMDAVLAQAASGGKALGSLPSAGFERVSQGRTLLVFDCGRTPPWPYDAQAHASPLAFELASGKERIFVNCGSHPVSSEWQDALRATAAHNTLGINNRNACEIGGGGHFTRRTKLVSPIREDSKNACLLEATHDGYMGLNGITHRRRLYLTDQGNDLRGEDSLSTSIMPGKPLEIAIRFHIHPRVLVSILQDSHAALLRLSTGIGWRFHHAGGRLALEDSIYMGQGGRPRKTKQLVIYERMDGERLSLKWALQREGL